MFGNDSEKNRRGLGPGFNMVIVCQYHFSLSPLFPSHTQVLVSLFSGDHGCKNTVVIQIGEKHI